MRAPFCSESPDFCPDEKDIIGSENENEIHAIEQSLQKSRTSKTAVFGISLDNLMGTSPDVDPQIPFIISRICNFIESHGMREKSLFVSGDEKSLVENLREEFAESGDAPLESTGHVASIAKLLIIFLEELPEPLIPVSAQSDFIKDIEKLSLNHMECLSSLKTSLEKLPDTTYRVLKYLSRFLLRITFHKEYNGMNSISLAVIFGPLIFRPSKKDQKSMSPFRDIMNCFVKDYYCVFENCEYSIPSGLSSSTLSLKSSKKPCPSSIMPIVSLSPLSVVIPAEQDECLSENENSNVPLLLIEGQLPVKSKHKNKAVAYKNKDLANGSEQPGVTLTRKRKERRFSGEDSLQRSFSEERPSPNPLDVCDSNDAIRRCCSHEEVTSHKKEVEKQSQINTKDGVKFAYVSHDLIDNSSNHSPHPPTAKRREIERDEDMITNDSWMSVGMQENDEDTQSTELQQNSIAESPPNNKQNSMDYDTLDKTSDDSSAEEKENYESPMGHIPRSSSCPIPQSESGKSSENDSLSLSWSMLFEDSEPVRAEPHLNLSKDVTHEDTLLSPSVRSLRHSDYYEAPVSPSAYRSYLSYRSTHLDPSVPPSPPVEQENFAKKTVETTSLSDSIKQLTKKIHSIKKRIKKYDEKFEAEYGFKPSHAEKSNNSEAKKLLNDLYKARKELKALKEEAQLEHVGTSWHVTQSHILEDSTNQFPYDATKNKASSSIVDSVGVAMKNLADNRKTANRPEAFDDMTNDQVKDEKLAIQKELLNFEKIHGKPVTREHRESCRPLYDRYRCVKRLLLRSGSFPGGNIKSKDLCSDLQPILEHETMHFPARQEKAVQDIKTESKEAVESEKEKINTQSPRATTTKEEQSSSSFLAMKYDNSNLHELPLSEMLFHMQNIKSEKRRLRKALKDFEIDFVRNNGKKVQKEDKVPVEALYNEYKHIKARVRLLEALISKHDQHKLM